MRKEELKIILQDRIYMGKPVVMITVFTLYFFYNEILSSLFNLTSSKRPENSILRWLHLALSSARVIKL